MCVAIDMIITIFINLTEKHSIKSDHEEDGGVNSIQSIKACMKPDKQNAKKPGIVYSCYHSASQDGEHFVPEHTLSFQVAGSLVLNDGSKSYASAQDSFRLI